MRTAIFLGLILVARAINPEHLLHDNVIHFTIALMVMDAIEFIHRIFFKRDQNN